MGHSGIQRPGQVQILDKVLAGAWGPFSKVKPQVLVTETEQECSVAWVCAVCLQVARTVLREGISQCDRGRGLP